jgi:hypothetical protein
MKVAHRTSFVLGNSVRRSLEQPCVLMAPKPAGRHDGPLPPAIARARRGLRLSRHQKPRSGRQFDRRVHEGESPRDRGRAPLVGWPWPRGSGALTACVSPNAVRAVSEPPRRAKPRLLQKSNPQVPDQNRPHLLTTLVRLASSVHTLTRLASPTHGGPRSAQCLPGFAYVARVQNRPIAASGESCFGPQGSHAKQMRPTGLPPVLVAQTARRLRPLARRALITARPPRLFMRTRKPWVRARRTFEA